MARATVSARLQRLEDSGVVTGYGPDVDVAAAGFGVQAFVTLEIAQGAIDDVQRDLEAIPGLLEAHATTGSGDVLCRVAASSHEALQQVLVDLNRSSAVVRSTSVIALSPLVPWRTLPLLESEAAAGRRPVRHAPRHGSLAPRNHDHHALAVVRPGRRAASLRADHEMPGVNGLTASIPDQGP